MRLILNSRGLNTKTGTEQIYNIIKNESLTMKTIYAVSYPYYDLDEVIKNSCIRMGFQPQNIFLSVYGIPEKRPDYFYVGEGNTYTILQYIKREGIFDYIQGHRQDDSVTYIGSSAGAMIAGSDIGLARDFESNECGIRDIGGLELFRGAIIPHYEPDQLERYLAMTAPALIEKTYENIYSVGDYNVLILNG